jgi:glycyl-tRNA synthetase beta chain
MNELFIEILTEEVPFLEHKNQRNAVMDFFAKTQELKGDLQVFSSRCRLVIVLKNFASEITIPSKKLKGPALTAPNIAIEGFLKKADAKREDLQEENGFFTFTTKEERKPLKNLLESHLLNEIFTAICSSFSKTMIWNEAKKPWIRPIKSIKISFNEEVLNFEYAGVKSSKFTGFDEKNQILDAKKRLEVISSSIAKIEAENGLKCVASGKLLEENSYLADFPLIKYSKFDPKYLQLPSKVLIQTLEKNQKYFLFQNSNGELSNIFAVCIDGNYNEETAKSIIEGNKRVLNARLEDALYYIKIDERETLKQHLEKTKKVAFHAKAGTVFERVEKMLEIASKIAPQNEDLKTAITLCKADLQTEMTQSFTELQGYIGAYYAKKEGYSTPICDAIASQYRLGVEEEPKGKPKLSLLLALIEKYEKITNLIKAGEIPTSSRDPFGIRRDALAIIKIIIEGELETHLEFTGELKSIILDRLKFYLKSFPQEAINPAMEFEFSCKEVSLLNLYKKIELLSKNISNIEQFYRISKILSTKEAQEFKGETLNINSLSGIKLELYEAIYKAKTLEEILLNAPLVDKFFEGNLVIESSNPQSTKSNIAFLQSILNKLNTFIKI